MLQTRVGKRTGRAALKMAVDMVRPTTWASPRPRPCRGSPRTTSSGPAPPVRRVGLRRCWAKGLGASPGAAVGRIYFTADDAAAAAERGEKVVLVRSETSPEDVHGMLASEGILTARGGLVSHAAVVARGWGKPAVVGAEVLRLSGPLGDGGRHAHEGDWVSLDGRGHRGGRARCR
jgi:pyruvate,orthophosphate dikinase